MEQEEIMKEMMSRNRFIDSAVALPKAGSKVIVLRSDGVIQKAVYIGHTAFEGDWGDAEKDVIVVGWHYPSIPDGSVIVGGDE